jgi:hypothetical protein
LLFYKATTAGNKGGVEPAKGDGPVDRRQDLRSGENGQFMSIHKSVPAASRLL